MALTVVSFSFKKGIPGDANTVFDARFLKNPYYDPALKDLDGRDHKVGAHIETDPAFGAFFEHLQALLLPIVPRYMEDGNNFTIAFGCTGGQHRSVYLAEKLAEVLRAKGYTPGIVHREIEAGRVS